MLRFHERKTLKGILYAKPVMLALLLPIGFLSYAAWNAYETARETTERREELTEELAALTSQAAALEEDIAELEDPRGIEAALRQQYDVAKEGEEVIVLIAEAGASEEELIEPQEEAQERSWWDRVRGWFGGE